MPSVVFLRGVNVGGHKTFRPSALARDLARLDVASVGAAGTFVVRRPVAGAALRDELERRLPFRADAMICRPRELLELAASDPFAGEPAAAAAGVTRYVSVLARRPRALPSFPHRKPDGTEWQVTLVACCGRLVPSLHRRVGRSLVYPNEVVEKALGVPATTRSWNTLLAVCALLGPGAARPTSPSRPGRR